MEAKTAILNWKLKLRFLLASITKLVKIESSIIILIEWWKI